jgi:hypothetical protein
MKTLALLCLASVSAFLGGCVPQRWENPSLSPQDWSRDQRECSFLAYNESRRIYYYDPFFFRPRYVRTRDGRLIAVAPDPFAYQHEQFVREMQLNDFCMRTRGYRLVPVPERGAESGGAVEEWAPPPAEARPRWAPPE